MALEWMFLGFLLVAAALVAFVYAWDNRCKHSYSIHREWNILNGITGRVVGTKVLLKCSKCGKLKFEENYL